MELHSVRYLYVEYVKSYAGDIKSLLTEMDITKSKAFLRTFVEKIVIDGNKCTIYISYLHRQSGRNMKKYEFCLLTPLVEIGGFEPPTSALRTRRSPS